MPPKKRNNKHKKRPLTDEEFVAKETWRVFRIMAEFVDSFEALVTQIHREKFNADPQKYSDALHLASEQRPDLARAYIGH